MGLGLRRVAILSVLSLNKYLQIYLVLLLCDLTQSLSKQYKLRIYIPEPPHIGLLSQNKSVLNHNFNQDYNSRAEHVKLLIYAKARKLSAASI